MSEPGECSSPKPREARRATRAGEDGYSVHRPLLPPLSGGPGGGVVGPSPPPCCPGCRGLPPPSVPERGGHRSRRPVGPGWPGPGRGGSTLSRSAGGSEGARGVRTGGPPQNRWRHTLGEITGLEPSSLSFRPYLYPCRGEITREVFPGLAKPLDLFPFPTGLDSVCGRVSDSLHMAVGGC